jgi:hypothetical protein
MKIGIVVMKQQGLELTSFAISTPRRIEDRPER